MNLSLLQNLSPLDQFEVRDLLSVAALGNLHISLTNIGLYLTIGGFVAFIYKIFTANSNKVVSNNWSISEETIYATVHSIVVSQINSRQGQVYFPFIYALFIFILVNNLLGMVDRCLCDYINNIFMLSSLFIINKKVKYNSYSTNNSSTSNYSYNKGNPTNKLNPYYLTGFVDGEGSFIVKIIKRSRLKVGFEVQLCFQITSHVKDRAVLENIKDYFEGIGSIHNDGHNCLQYRVSSNKDLNLIIKHFEEYPLITQKRADYLLFKSILVICNLKEHLTHDGLKKIVNIRASINNGLTEKLKEAFPDVLPVVRPEVKDQVVKDPHWFVGFADAEGCFNVGVYKQNNNTKVRLSFSISQHSRDRLLINSIVNFLACGSITTSRNSVVFYVANLKSNKDTIIPFFFKYPLQSTKRLDFSDWHSAVNLLNSKAHLTEPGSKELLDIKENIRSRKTN